MQLSIPMMDLALPPDITKGELCFRLGISDKKLRKDYLTDEFFEKYGTTYEQMKTSKFLGLTLTAGFFETYPQWKRPFVLEFLQNPAISGLNLELPSTS